jgi:hypothetical protein
MSNNQIEQQGAFSRSARVVAPEASQSLGNETNGPNIFADIAQYVDGTNNAECRRIIEMYFPNIAKELADLVVKAVKERIQIETEEEQQPNTNSSSSRSYGNSGVQDGLGNFWVFNLISPRLCRVGTITGRCGNPWFLLQ